MSTADLWLTRARLVTPQGIIDAAVKIRGGRISAVRPSPPRGEKTLSVGGAYLAPGFIDLHVWGAPRAVARDAAKSGATAFLTTLGPARPRQLLAQLIEHAQVDGPGAECLGVHLEGPFVNPTRAGALPRRGMRAPTTAELDALRGASANHLRLVTIAPELRDAREAIRWCQRHGILASLGHSEADAATALRAVGAGATVVTHVFNGMPRFSHREPALVDVALTDPRLTTMVIADGVHVSPTALRLLVRAKGVSRIALVTDSIAHQGWDVVVRQARPGSGEGRAGGAYYTRTGVLAGSRLTMVRAVENMVRLAGVSLSDAVHMASAVPARLLSLARSRGTLRLGARADFVAFDRRFRVQMTMVGGRVVYQRKGF